MKALRVIVQTLQPALADDHELLTFLSHRAYALGIPLAQLKGRNRDQLINLILKPAPSKGDYWMKFLRLSRRSLSSAKVSRFRANSRKRHKKWCQNERSCYLNQRRTNNAKLAYNNTSQLHRSVEVTVCTVARTEYRIAEKASAQPSPRKRVQPPEESPCLNSSSHRRITRNSLRR